MLWHSFSEADSRYLDLFRVGYGLGFLTFTGLSFYTVVYQGKPFDPVGFGTGLAAILFGGGVGVGLRGRFEDGQSLPAAPYNGPKDPPGEPVDGPPPGG